MNLEVFVSARKHDYAEVMNNKSSPKGPIKNISSGGCSISSPFRFEINMPVFISGELPNGKVLDNVMGFVRNVTRDQNENMYGIQLDERCGPLEGLREFVILASKIVSKGDANSH